MYEKDARRKIRSAWRNFQCGKPVETGDVREVVLDSWKRCKGYVDPYQQTIKQVSALNIKKRLDNNAHLLTVAHDFLKYLYEKILNGEGMVVLSDAEGIIILAMGSSGSASAPELGTDWREKTVGTNAVGTCLLLKQPIQIWAEEHYCQFNHLWYCSGAPIFAPDGKLLGCLNVSGTSESVHAHTLGMVIGVADAIEKQLRINQVAADNQKIIRQQSEILEIISDGVLIVEPTGNISHVNQKALQLLQTSKEEILHKPLKNIIPSGIEIQELFHSQKMLHDLEINMGLPERRKNCFILTALTKNAQGIPESIIISFKPAKKAHAPVNKVTGFKGRYSFEHMIGKSIIFQQVIHQGKLAASNNLHVLLTGESGTGKDLMARAIHEASDRSQGPFIAINCGALPQGLVESELFGFEGGAFTGSKKEGNPGKFELADGGTIYLDEIGEMPLDVQVALLRVIQEKCITRIGGNKPKQIDIRVIAATNKNLEEEVLNKKFRRDLYFRLNVISIRMPSLIERTEDLGLLIDDILERLKRQTGKTDLSIGEDAMYLLKAYHWPGNIRELENVLDRAVCVCDSQTITSRELPNCLLQNEVQLSPDLTLIKQNERVMIMEVLAETNGNVKQTAERLGVARSTIYRKLKKYGISIRTAKGRKSGLTITQVDGSFALYH
ncbi:MAG: sigma-54-dependent Fis family transcriptional regulator [Syntrophaceticus sp.]|nr:sigma-54-dependent Fis family transcriptional regulator [Syntrophaceticus sp.]MDD4360586.1 sigma-54-dependent Fis family transcriptional regulator [Syntrophaceticus sp.]MDD4782790.1 sigma-54-dependent Fis family transcriptional regulator [Syntrophaceticus sp.]